VTFVSSTVKSRHRSSPNTSGHKWEEAIPGREARSTRVPDQGAGYQLLRSPPNPRDKQLSDLAKVWVDRLPAAHRPLSLCLQYPRIANRIALCWADQALTEMVFSELLQDRRGNRRGFPAAVNQELLTLISAHRGRPEIQK
jgi:hypothetical protein